MPLSLGPGIDLTRGQSVFPPVALRPGVSFDTYPLEGGCMLLTDL
jgi:hypothetical protein